MSDIDYWIIQYEIKGIAELLHKMEYRNRYGLGGGPSYPQEDIDKVKSERERLLSLRDVAYAKSKED